MVIESALFKAAVTGFSKNASTVASMVGKQVLERAVKEALDRALTPALKPSLANLPILEQALLGLSLSKEEADALETFLNSRAFEKCVQAVGLISDADESALSLQQAALEAFLNRILPDKPGAAIANFAQEVLEVIAKTAPDAWQTAIELGIVGQSWRSELAIQNLVSDQILNARRQLEERIAATSSSFAEVEAFAQRYKRSVRFATSKLKPQSLHESFPVPIDQLYVEPLLNLAYQRDSSPSPRSIALAASRRSVILGNPGGGKSTFAGKLCYDVCSDLFEEGNSDLPELAAQVTLRDYAQYRRANPCSIIEYLQLHSKSEFQIEPPINAFKLLLLLGRIIIVFDGLDELIEIKDRSEICSAVEHFALEYPIAPILVTSREVGYEQASLDRVRFTHFKLSPFGEEQVKAYAAKWFALSCSTHKEATRLETAFITESSILRDICSNPLMLGLLCNLYRQDGFLPKNRPEVYQRCADLLFTKWDRGRGIYIKLPLEHRLRPAMSHLAYWIYSGEKLQGGVAEDQLVEETSKYLRQWVEDDAEANSIAQQFVSFFSGRAWVFTDMGSDRTQRLYQFTHRTFLEFFTAEELVRLHPTPESLCANLIDRIRTRSWDVVCQLAFQLIVERTKSHNSLVDLLCKEAKEAELPHRLNVLSFLARTMDLLYPMPRARRDAVRLCVQTVFTNLLMCAGSETLEKLASETLVVIMTASEEALKINASELKSVLFEILRSETMDSDAKAQAVLLASALPSVLWMEFDDEKMKYWEDELGDLSVPIELAVNALSLTERDMALLSWSNMSRTADELCNVFAPSILYESLHFPIADFYWASILACIAGQTLGAIFLAAQESDQQNVNMKKRSDWLNSEAKSIRDIILRTGVVTISASSLMMGFNPMEYSRQYPEQILRWPEDTEVVEGILVCNAVLAEVVQPELSSTENLSAAVYDLTMLYYSRSSDSFRVPAHDVVERLCKTQSIKAKLHAWVEGEISFTRKKP